MASPYHRDVIYTPEGPAARLLNLDVGALAQDLSDQAVAAFVEQHHEVLFF